MTHDQIAAVWNFVWFGGAGAVLGIMAAVEYGVLIERVDRYKLKWTAGLLGDVTMLASAAVCAFLVAGYNVGKVIYG